MEPITEDYIKTRQGTEALCEPIQIEDYTPQSAIFASPPKWHIAHTTWFFEEMILKNYLADYSVFDDSFGYLFNSYYNSIGERLQRHNRGLLTRPSIDKVFEYRSHVDQKMTELLESTTEDAIISLTVLGINHEQQHQELLLTDLKYTLSLNPLYPKLQDHNYVTNYNVDAKWISVAEGIYSIGHKKNGFSFDNELGVHRVFIEPFEICNGLVTNKEFLDFMDDGGYDNPDYWLEEAWYWLKDQKINKPLYWKKKDNRWYQFTLSGLKILDPNAILTHISFFEASAFAQWKGYRLPTEFEWEVASNFFSWGTTWEWTNSAYLPYPQFKKAKGAVGEYNGKFMINQMVLRGGSKATAPNHSRNTYRNFFHPQTQYQFSGIRLAR